nr:MAG TPA: hypothetical protein [Caudoviricetes sp.]
MFFSPSSRPAYYLRAAQWREEINVIFCFTPHTSL